MLGIFDSFLLSFVMDGANLLRKAFPPFHAIWHKKNKTQRLQIKAVKMWKNDFSKKRSLFSPRGKVVLSVF